MNITMDAGSGGPWKSQSLGLASRHRLRYLKGGVVGFEVDRKTTHKFCGLINA